MSENEISTPGQDERNLAALAHGSVIIPFIGAAAPVMIWVTQRARSEYLSFQALQAAVYQMSIMIAWVVGGLCYFFTMILTILAMPLIIKDSGEINPFFWAASFIPFIIVGVLIILGFAYIAYGLAGMVRAYQGNPFRYIIIAKWVDRFLQSNQNP